MNRWRNAFALVAVLAASAQLGCASSVAVLEGFRPVDESARLQIADARPEKEKSSELLSFAVTSCDYGIRRLGDEVTVPSRLAIMQSDLVRSLGPAVYGKNMTVSHYTIHYNNGASQRRGASSAAGVSIAAALIGSAMQGIGSDCAKEKTTEGWYSASELNRPHSPIIIEIEAEISGNVHAVRSVYAPPREFGGRFGEPEAAHELFVAISRAHTALSESIKRRASQASLKKFPTSN